MSKLTSTLPPASTGVVTDLLGLLAYGELLAFQRMAADATLAPDLTRRAMLCEMASLEIVNFRRIADRLAELGGDVTEAMIPFGPALDGYHDQTEPNSWLEALTKAYVGDSITDDFVREVAEFLGPTDRRLVGEVLHDSRYGRFAADEIRGALAAEPGSADRLSMWARRLVGEAISQAQRVAAQRESFAELLVGSGDAIGGDQIGGDNVGVAAMLKRLTTAHTNRMSAVGLNN